jgi:tight adherence protein C
MTYVIAAAVFGSVGLVSWVILSLFFSNERAVARRLNTLTTYEAGQAAVAHPQLQPFSERMLRPGLARVKNAVAGMAPTTYRSGVRRQLVLAGMPRGLDADRFVLIKVTLSISVGCLLLGAAVIAAASALMWLAALLGIFVAFFAPDAWLSARIRTRQKEIRRNLPDMLDMLTISIEAGLGFDQAIAKIVHLSRGALAREFSRALQEIQAGSNRSEALRNMAKRTEVDELNTFITSIVQAEQLGIPIGQVLRTQAKEMRLIRRQTAEEQAQKTPVKIVFPLILCILPATLIVILGPAVVSIGAVFGVW